MGNLKREVWEGWTPQDFIDALSDEIDMIMTNKSCRKPFQTEEELIKYIVDNQPYYKKPIPEVNEYFADRYRLKSRKQMTHKNLPVSVQNLLSEEQKQEIDEGIWLVTPS